MLNGPELIPSPAELASVVPAPVKPAPVKPAPVKPAPVKPAPLEPTPLEPTPLEPTPLEPTPLEPTPLEPTPLEPTPLEQNPDKRTPSEPVPVEQRLEVTLQRGYPTWWDPAAISPEAFYEEAGLELIRIGAMEEYPCLLLSGDLFFSVWRCSTAERECDVVRVDRDEKLQRITQRVDIIDKENIRDRELIQAIEQRAQSLEGTEYDEIAALTNYLKDQIDRRNKVRDNCIEEEDKEIRRYIATEENACDLQRPMITTLVDIFDDLGVLPQLNNIRAPPAVQVMEERPSVDNIEGVEKPHPDFAGQDDQMVRLGKGLEDAIDDVLQIKAEIGQFRDGFDDGMHRWMEEERLINRGKPASQADLETRFGPIWLSRHQVLMRKLAAAHTALRNANRALMAAKCKEQMTGQQGLHPLFQDHELPGRFLLKQMAEVLLPPPAREKIVNG
ncbi:hypothetical protein FB567DRAFT_284047 [Paraphoma chrysanthemicola]|uniref:Uncharacterized protein n=1 Tax=Paraphoma chrysanthemicola TaxID=798071 RepID=A0A8K0VR37_9PLEO|nr:hypothetical protein FB567DRAFT_284047 [Paraphoma chrysanthemicola]